MGHPTRSLADSRTEYGGPWKPHSKGFSGETIATARLETILVTFWQRLWLVSAFVLRFFMRLNWKIMD